LVIGYIRAAAVPVEMTYVVSGKWPVLSKGSTLKTGDWPDCGVGEDEGISVLTVKKRLRAGGCRFVGQRR